MEQEFTNDISSQDNDLKTEETVPMGVFDELKKVNHPKQPDNEKINDALFNDLNIFDKRFDDVECPQHYTDGNIEVIDFIEDKNLGFCLGNAVKYIARAGKKHSSDKSNKDKAIQDLNKARWYINRRIKELEEDICK